LVPLSLAVRLAGRVLQERGWLGLGGPAVDPCSLLGSVLWWTEAAAAVVAAAAGLAVLTVPVMDSQQVLARMKKRMGLREMRTNNSLVKLEAAQGPSSWCLHITSKCRNCLGVLVR
jgi:hypothetical protein